MTPPPENKIFFEPYPQPLPPPPPLGSRCGCWGSEQHWNALHTGPSEFASTARKQTGGWNGRAVYSAVPGTMGKFPNPKSYTRAKASATGPRQRLVDR